MRRPSFAAAWRAAMRIYSPSDPDEKVAMMVGGWVAKNIHSSDPTLRWSNTCVVRMSYILHQCGLPIPALAQQTVSGADGRQYFFRIEDIRRFFLQRWGPSEASPHPQHTGLPAVAEQGVIIFETSGWNDARGHVSLVRNGGCYDHGHFDGGPGANYRVDRLSFWSLPP